MERGSIIVISIIIAAVIAAIVIQNYQSAATDPNALYSKGIALFESGKYEEAISVFDQVLAIDPGSDAALNAKVA